jgi:hypothetical protein
LISFPTKRIKLIIITVTIKERKKMRKERFKKNVTALPLEEKNDEGNKYER